jgi:hypothetical protein
MTVRFAQWTLDASDVDLMSRFWSQALGYRVEATESDPFVVLADPEGNEFCVLRNEPRQV